MKTTFLILLSVLPFSAGASQVSGRILIKNFTQYVSAAKLYRGQIDNDSNKKKAKADAKVAVATGKKPSDACALGLAKIDKTTGEVVANIFNPKNKAYLAEVNLDPAANYTATTSDDGEHATITYKIPASKINKTTTLVSITTYEDSPIFDVKFNGVGCVISN